ncbi:MAG TPA: flotillin family protein, partial [Allocoleopsis sp.]
MKSKYVANLEPDGVMVHVAQVNAESPPNVQTMQAGSSMGMALPIALTIFGAMLVVWFVNSFMKICNPNEIMILSGRKHRNKEGQEVGYRVIFG